MTASDRALKAATIFWFVVLLAGQWVFVAYILGFYGEAALKGDLNGWNALHETQGINLSEEKRKRFGYIPGDLIGNIILGTHLLFAAVVTFGGTLQLMPALRDRWRAFHRWNGRLFVLTAIVTSLAGTYLSWARDNPGGLYVSIATSLNGGLIIIAALVAWRLAVARRIEAHHRWALRLFVLASGVWFFRVMFMTWMIIHQAPVGHTDDFTGPFDLAVAFGSFLLPWVLLEIYLWIKAHGSATSRWLMAGWLLILTLLMAVGIVGAAAMMWIPNI